MVISTRTFTHPKRETYNSIHEKYMKFPAGLQLEKTHYLPPKIRRAVDFVLVSARTGTFVFGELKVNKAPIATRRSALYKRIPFVSREQAVENKIERLEEQCHRLVKNTWSYVFSGENVKEMRELSEGMLEDSKKMHKLADQLEGLDDEI